MKLLLILVLASCAFAYNVQRNRIVGGEYASAGQFPYQISQRIHGSHFCGGAIINPNTILSASHCLETQEVWTIRVVVGAITMDDGTWHDVSHYVLHEDYDTNTVVNDIAVIKLQTSIQYTWNVQPIEYDANFINTGATTVVAGWGYTSWPPTSTSYYLFYFYGTVYDLDACKVVNKNDRYPVEDTNICNFSKNGQGVCGGDSGGGLVVNGKHAGIASWVLPCGVGSPDVFTRTSSYVDWINRQ